MSFIIVLAYDGSIHGDWVARYAMRLAAQQPDRTLTLVHVRTHEVEAEALDDKLRHIETECAVLGVRPEVDVAPPQGSVFVTLAACIPAGAGTFVVCGARLRGGRGGYLSGTVSERLLKPPSCSYRSATSSAAARASAWASTGRPSASR